MMQATTIKEKLKIKVAKKVFKKKTKKKNLVKVQFEFHSKVIIKELCSCG
jgi:hypothetical protein